MRRVPGPSTYSGGIAVSPAHRERADAKTPRLFVSEHTDDHEKENFS